MYYSKVEAKFEVQSHYIVSFTPICTRVSDRSLALVYSQIKSYFSENLSVYDLDNDQLLMTSTQKTHIPST